MTDGDCGGAEEASEKEGMGVCCYFETRKEYARLRQTLHLIGTETCPCPELYMAAQRTCGYNVRVGYAF